MKTIYKIRINKILKYSIKLFCLFVLINLVGCKDQESCGYDDTCTFKQTNSELSGWTVATCYARNANNPVGVIYDTSQNSTAPLGDDWGAILDPTPPNSPKAIHPASWTPANIGQVFGIAIDDNENIYLASSHIYAQGISPIPPQNTVPAQVFKCSAPTWNPIPLFTLSNSGVNNLNGIGNIAYDKKNNQLFTTNLEDGKIYRHDTNGIPLGSTAFDPWTADTNTPGIVSQDEQVWGVGVNYEAGVVKVYFPRITSTGLREIYSITLNDDGSFPTSINPEIIEISNVPGTQTVISDIAFSSNANEMLISERDNPHSAKVMSYSRTGVTWSFNKQYFVGGFSGENSAGGIDFAYKEQNGYISAVCDDFFWASGNYMDARNVSGKIYGLQGILYSGNNPVSATIPTANQDTDIFIDLNPPNYSTGAKNTVGDVEVFDANKCFDLCN